MVTDVKEHSRKLQGERLGDIALQLDRFSNLKESFDHFNSDTFQSLPFRKKFKEINQTLLRQIEKAPEPAFLLGAVSEYIERVNKEELLSEPYTFQKFEFWLNQFSKLNKTDNYRIRAKIAGKFIPRDDYQIFFPVGMGKSYRGSHFVAAHLSPDIDTTISSFWGWIDAFAARVGEGLHIWYLPGGAPESHFKTLFQKIFSSDAFSILARENGKLSLTAQDLVTKRGMDKKPGHTLTGSLDHRANGKAVLLVDQKGHWQGDWRSRDVEGAKQVVTDFNACLRWFENSLHVKLISLFAKENLTKKDIAPLVCAIFDSSIGDCEPARDFPERQRRHLTKYIKEIFGIEKGLNGTFGDLIQALNAFSIEDFGKFESLVTTLGDTSLFDENGNLKEDRPAIFTHLQKMIRTLDEAIAHSRDFVDRLDMMVTLKHDVLKSPKTFTTLQCDVEEMKQKMGNRDYLTVVIPHGDNTFFPVGIVDAEDLRRQSLGTVTLRDFSNEEETHMAPYLEVISVVDHHKISLNTSSPPMAIIGDAQSSNVLVAEQTFLINDRYSTLLNDSPTKENNSLRIQHRRLTKQMAAEERGEHYVHPLREYTEYLCFLYAILDDTDLLSKVSKRDVLCTAELLNRMKSLSVGDEVEVINFSDLASDENFSKKAAKRLLQNPELYSIYKTVYLHREKSVEEQLRTNDPELFADTKAQNGCGRVGQMKFFAANFPTLKQEIPQIRKHWLDNAIAINTSTPKLDLHIQMISTISGAEEVYKGDDVHYTHHDELWIWSAETVEAEEHLSQFLRSFREILQVAGNHIRVELSKKTSSKITNAFENNFQGIPIKIVSENDLELPIAIIKFSPGMINSRKAMISPHIPRVL